MDIVVGTCGRVKDMIERGALKLDGIRFVVLDEADEMLNIGFAEDIESIMNSVTTAGALKPQTLLFSATWPAWVQKIEKKYLRYRKVPTVLPRF